MNRVGEERGIRVLDGKEVSMVAKLLTVVEAGEALRIKPATIRA